MKHLREGMWIFCWSSSKGEFVIGRLDKKEENEEFTPENSWLFIPGFGNTGYSIKDIVYVFPKHPGFSPTQLLIDKLKGRKYSGWCNS